MNNIKYTPKNPPEVGQDVYSASGHIGKYLAPSPSPYHAGLVVMLYQHDDQDDDYCDPDDMRAGMLSAYTEIWPEAYKSVPVHICDEQIAKQRETLAELTNQAKAKRAEIDKLDRDKAIIMREAKANPDLAPLALWLEGKAKFATILGSDYGGQWDKNRTVTGPIPEIFKAGCENIDRGKIRLVSLFYDPEAEYQYSVRVMRYSSGDSDRQPQRAFLGETAEESLKAAAEHIAGRGKTNRHNAHDYAAMGAWLEHFGFADMRDERMIREQKDQEEKAAKRLAEQAEKSLADAQQRLAQAQAEYEKHYQADGISK